MCDVVIQEKRLTQNKWLKDNTVSQVCMESSFKDLCMFFCGGIFVKFLLKDFLSISARTDGGGGEKCTIVAEKLQRPFSVQWVTVEFFPMESLGERGLRGLTGLKRELP